MSNKSCKPVAVEIYLSVACFSRKPFTTHCISSIIFYPVSSFSDFTNIVLVNLAAIAFTVAALCAGCLIKYSVCFFSIISKYIPGSGFIGVSQLFLGVSVCRQDFRLKPPKSRTVTGRTDRVGKNHISGKNNTL